jgi:hypothetical protein
MYVHGDGIVDNDYNAAFDSFLKASTNHMCPLCSLTGLVMLLLGTIGSCY